jgi:F-type H+-transporting ATPase subunit b
MKSLFAASSALTMVAGEAFARDTMPQLQFSNPLLLSQVVWGALIFLVFYLAVSRWGLPRVGAILENRERTIGGDLEQARLSKQSADRAVAELTEARRLAYVESKAAIAAATQKAKEAAALRAAEVNARLDKQLADAESQIAAARNAALGALREVAGDTTAAIVSRLTGRGAGSADVAQAVDEALGRRGLAHA